MAAGWDTTKQRVYDRASIVNGTERWLCSGCPMKSLRVYKCQRLSHGSRKKITIGPLECSCSRDEEYQMRKQNESNEKEILNLNEIRKQTQEE